MLPRKNLKTIIPKMHGAGHVVFSGHFHFHITCLSFFHHKPFLMILCKIIINHRYVLDFHLIHTTYFWYFYAHTQQVVKQKKLNDTAIKLNMNIKMPTSQT